MICRALFVECRPWLWPHVRPGADRWHGILTLTSQNCQRVIGWNRGSVV